MAKPKGRLSLFFYFFFNFFHFFWQDKFIHRAPFPLPCMSMFVSQKKKKKKSLPTKFSCQSLPINMVDQNNNYMMKR